MVSFYLKQYTTEAEKCLPLGEKKRKLKKMEKRD